MTSVNGSSSADASAAAWAEGTLAQAEAFSQAQADAAANERDAREQAAANGNYQPPNDGVDRPSSEQRALDAFWGNDPNRPADTLPGGGGGSSSSPSGDGRHSVSAQDAADLRAAGYTVVEENGQYYFEAPAENVSVVEQAPPEPVIILPSFPGSTPNVDGGAPPPTDAGPADAGAPNVQDASTPAQVQDPNAPKEISSGLGAETDAILNKSPTLQKEWAALEDKGWKVKFGEAGKGSYADRNGTPPTIVLDPNMKNNPSLLAETFSHEMGHAAHTLSPEIGQDGLTKDQYVQKNLDRHLDDEGAANFKNAQAKDEISSNGGPADFGINGVQDEKYQAIYNDYKAGKITEQQAAHQMGQVFADGERTSVDNQTYRDYYSDAYEKAWDTSHPPGSS